MPVKLNQVLRKLNVGLSTAADFLRKKGHVIVDNPNTRLSDEQSTLLVKEFGHGMTETDFGVFTAKPPVKKEVTPPPAPKEEKAVEEIKIPVPKLQFVQTGYIDLNHPKKQTEEPAPEKEFVLPKEPAPKKEPAEEQPKPAAPKEEPKKEEPKEPVKEVVAPPPAPVKESAKEPVAVKEEAPKEAVAESKPASEPVKVAPEEETPFRLNRPKLESGIKVTGMINLDALNQSTRPKKKTKDEKKKERDDKYRTGHSAKPNPAAPATAGQAATAGTGQGAAKKKRRRIKKDRIDVNNTPGTNARPVGSVQSRSDANRSSSRLKRPLVKKEVSEEDVQKQVKETLARLTNKGNKSKGSKYRRDKRDAAVQREHRLHEQEERESRILKITEFVTANDLANMMDLPVTQIIGTCMNIGMMVSINQRLDAETINIVADEFGFKTEYVSAEVAEAINSDDEYDNEEDRVTRPPIVTVMGHVDHGKTSLLDNIRKANVIAGEAGGITQHIGAYNVTLPNGRHITFLDTPGHEAFTAMRARGAKVTDIAIIIVAADDSVMPQTVEAINHASAAGVPIVFAINKIDKPGANPEKIKEELANMNYLLEEWGGKYQSHDISAKKGVGIDELLEKVLLEADLLDLKANPTKRAVGSIIESALDKGRGYVSTVLVENGTLKAGDIVLAGTQYGRIKAMFNERNQRVERAAPSEPVLILGLNGAPQAGDTFNVLETEQEAREIATRREQLQRELGLRTQRMLTLDDIGRRIAVGNFQELNVIVKGDVDGSVEALSDSLIRLSTEEIQVNVIHKAVGQISESDVALAASSNAIIIGFQVRPSQSARRNAEKEGVEIRLYSIIYSAIDEVRAAMEGMLSPEIREEITANVEVQQVFKITKVGTIAGCIVKEGKIKRTNKIRLIRDGIVIHSGLLESLKRFKDDAKEVVSGQDCGLNIQNFNDIMIGDIIEAYEETEIKKTL
ncbi:Translation initiation factor IF-2 [Bacteroidales bacterium Barb6]|nr:Translation initiation factor IF-2 [Bacteroidales bacterium Barb6]